MSILCWNKSFFKKVIAQAQTGKEIEHGNNQKETTGVVYWEAANLQCSQIIIGQDLN
jgi:hypothetical protein